MMIKPKKQPETLAELRAQQAPVLPEPQPKQEQVTTPLDAEQQKLYESLKLQVTPPDQWSTLQKLKVAFLPEIYGADLKDMPDIPPDPNRSLGMEALASVARGFNFQMRKLPYQAVKILGGDVLGSETVKQTMTPLIENIETVEQKLGLGPSPKAKSTIDPDKLIEEPGEALKQIKNDITNPYFWAANIPQGLASLAEFYAYGGGAAAMAKKALGLEVALAKASTPAAAAKIASRINKINFISGFGASVAMEAAGAEENLRQWEKENPDKKIDWAQRVIVELGTGFLSGSLEFYSFNKIFEGKAGHGLVMKALDIIATEGGTEGAQELVANAFRKYGYDPDQRLLENVVESILVGAAVGGIAGVGRGTIESVPQIRDRIKTVLEGQKLEKGEPVGEQPQVQPTNLQAAEPVRQKTGTQEFLPGFDYTAIIQPEQRGGPVLEPAPPGTPPIYLPSGELARTPEYMVPRWQVLADYEEALSKPAHQRTAEEKWLVDTVKRQGIDAVLPAEFRTPGMGGPGVSTVLGPWGGPASHRPPILDAQGRPIDVNAPPPPLPPPPELVGPSGRPIVKPVLPPAFGGPRPEPMATTGDETTEAAHGGKEPVPARPAAMAQADLLDKVQMLARRVDQYGDPRDTKELSDLLAANRETLRDLFTVPPEDRSGLRPIAERLHNLMQEVEETGDPGLPRSCTI
jgi:hypothetical protein